MISRRRARPWIALLLPLMLLRSLLPPGFMPVADGGELQIVMCSAGLVVQQDTGTAGQDHSQAPDSSCLFAHAAAFAPPSAAACCHLAPPSLSFDIPGMAQAPLASGPSRFAAARGPPQLLKSCFA